MVLKLRATSSPFPSWSHPVHCQAQLACAKRAVDEVPEHDHQKVVKEAEPAINPSSNMLKRG